MTGDWCCSFPITGALCAGMLWATSVVAMTTRDQVTLKEWTAALEEADVPSEIMYAIGLQESGTTLGGQRNYAPWPWVLNVNNEGHYFKSKEDFGLALIEHFQATMRAAAGPTARQGAAPSAEAAQAAMAREVERGNRNVAVGMLQIHLRYNGFRVEDPLSLLEPSVNLRIAAEVLRECGKTYPDTFSKVACYYSGDVDAAGHGYAAQVFRRAGLRGTAVTTVRRDASTWRRPPSLWAAASAPLVSADDIAFLKSLHRTTDPEPRVIVLDGLTP